LGAFAKGRLVGIGVVVPHPRPATAQLTFLHVSEPCRAAGIGSRLSEELEQIARAAGHSEMVVSATPSENTVRFCLNRGYAPWLSRRRGEAATSSASTECQRRTSLRREPSRARRHRRMAPR
jgi:GNAT superfamily N-acetyltransferase